MNMMDIETIKEFITDERKAIEAYSKSALETSSPIISNMYHKIAEDEMRHLQMLEEVLESMQEGKCKVR